jgi:hypothetical protein
MRSGEYVTQRVKEIGPVSVWIVNGRLRVLQRGSDREALMFIDPALISMCVGTYDSRADCAMVDEDVEAMCQVVSEAA